MLALPEFTSGSGIFLDTSSGFKAVGTVVDIFDAAGLVVVGFDGNCWVLFIA